MNNLCGGFFFSARFFRSGLVGNGWYKCSNGFMQNYFSNVNIVNILELATIPKY